MTSVLRNANISHCKYKPISMNLSDYIKTQPRGSLLSLAKEIVAHPPDVSNWASGNRPVPIHHAVAIERVTAGKVTRQDLRPDDWMDIWPELVPDRAA